MIWNIPNIITVIRIIVAILFVPVYFYEEANGTGHTVALSMYVFASVTDVIDGYIARKYNLITEFGKIFDPIADKLFQFLVVVCISFHDKVFILPLIIIFLKELCMAIGTYKLYKNKTVVQANIYGKIASVVYFFLFFGIIGFETLLSQGVKISMLILFLVSSLTAFINYFIQYFKLKKKNV